MSMMGYDPAVAQEAIPPAAAKPGPGGPAEPADLLASTGYLLARLGAESRRRWARMLADHGLIQRTGDPADRRRRAIGLTPAGQRMLNQLRQAADAIEADMLKGLDQHQQASLHR